jgi:hypothetical protein
MYVILIVTVLSSDDLSVYWQILLPFICILKIGVGGGSDGGGGG